MTVFEVNLENLLGLKSSKVFRNFVKDNIMGMRQMENNKEPRMEFVYIPKWDYTKALTDYL